jgi:1-deoxy-D-xylulose-5-phosphate synthase
MMSGTGIIGLHEKYPERVLDVGIAEGHAVTCAAGLAAEGSKPFVAIYSTFLQRALDHIIHDVAIQKLPVRFALDRAGLVGVDGPTHHGCFDLTYLRMIPNMVVMVPADGSELRLMTQFAYEHDGPIAMRYPRGKTAIWDENAAAPIQLGKGKVIQEGSDIALFAVGVMVETAIAIAEILEEQGLDVAVINARFVKPLDEELLQKFAKSCQLIVTLEENVIAGGFGSAVLESLQQSGTVAPVQTIGLPDRYISQGSPEQQREEAGLSVTKIVGSITGRLREIQLKSNKFRNVMAS